MLTTHIFKLVLILDFSANFCLSVNELSDYDYSILRASKKNDIRRKILAKRIRNSKDKIDKTVLPKTNLHLVHVDGVPHFEVIKNHRDGRRVEKMEKEFRLLLAMRGGSYIFKRDLVWRTWREVDYPTGKKVVWYKCMGFANLTCSKCSIGGYWTIEEDPPPCPYEVYSMVDSNSLCVSNYSQLRDARKTCPTTIQYYELTRSCDNPIITNYRITKNFSAPDMYDEICNGQEFCEISTIYQVFRDNILFRIANSTNDVIFSKFMKSDKKKFACLEKCGRIDRYSRYVAQNYTPVIFDVLPLSTNNNETTKATTLITRKSP